MTNKAKSGKTIFINCFVEWLVRDTRDVAGEHHQMGTKKKLTRAILLQEKQIQDDEDEVDLEHAVSTTILFVKDKYKGAELKVVYRKLKGGWDSIETDFPLKEAGEKKGIYATAICQACQILFANNPS